MVQHPSAYTVDGEATIKRGLPSEFLGDEMIIQTIKDDFKWIAKLYDNDLSCKRDLICVGYAEGETEEVAIFTLKKNYLKEKEIRASMKITEWNGNIA